jgi:hypothetical protein
MELGWLDFATVLIERTEESYGRAAAWTLAIASTLAPLILVIVVLWWAFS